MKKLKITSLILAVIMVVSMLPLGMVSAFAAGPSDATSPTIGTAAEFVQFMENWMGTEGYYDGKTVTLTADIDLSGVELPKLYAESEGTYSKIENTFTGTFDGDGHAISGYAIVNSRGDGITSPANINDIYGLFGRTLSGEATIKNLTLNGVLGKDYPTEPKMGATVNAADVGALYGWISGTLTVENVTVNGITSGSRSAGFVYGVRSAGKATFTNCEMGGKVLNTWTQNIADGVGGFVGRNEGSVEIINCLMSGYVAEMRLNTTGGDNGMIHMGGLVGYNQGTLDISGSIVSGTVVSHSTQIQTPTANAGVGGFVGYSKGTCEISGSMIHQTAHMEAKLPASATSNSGYNVGGFVGRAESGPVLTVENCAMYGTVTSNSLRSGMYFGHAGATDFTLKGCISGGSGTMNNRTNQLGYGGTITNNLSNYNIQTANNSNGMASTYGENSIYGRPYYVTASNLYTLETLKAAVKALIDAVDSADPNGEVAGTEAWYNDNWTFSGSALPVPAGCVSTFAKTDWYANETANGNTTLEINNQFELLAFATALNGGKTFEGLTVNLTADITLNEGWDAFEETEDSYAENTTEKAITPATTKWPVGAGKWFAGTFDGQGHTISGIYQTVANQNVGIFGNVARDKSATVKNVAIVNSYVQGGQGTGGIFGCVQETSTATAIIDNVYADINVKSGYVNTTLGGSNYNGNDNRSNGTGGLIGGVRANATITNTAFVGRVYGGHLRGTSGLIGTFTAAATNTVTIENCYIEAHLTSDAKLNNRGEEKAESYVGAIMGHVPTAGSTVNVTNVVSNCTIGGEINLYNGYTFGGSYAAVNYNLENITYVATEHDTVSKPFGRGNGSPILNTTTVSDLTKLTDDEWATYGVKKVASAAELPAVLFAYNVSGMSVTLTDDLAANLYADFAIANKDYAGEDVVVTEVGDEYRISYVDILPQQMGDDVVIDLGASGKKTVNVKNYLVTLLDDEAAQGVAADLLRYGAAAQTYSKYQGETIMDDELAATLATIAGSTVDASAIVAADPVLTNKGDIAGVALRLENSLALVARDADGNTIATKSLMATQMDEVLTVATEDGISSVQVSVAWYVKAALNGGVTDTNALALIEAIYAYGLSAKAYANV